MTKGDKIILLQQGEKREVYGSLREIAKLKNLKENTLYKKKFPFSFKGINFTKLKFRNESGII
jgi:hypothetical protein